MSDDQPRAIAAEGSPRALQAELERVTAELERFVALTDHSPVGIVAVDADGRVVFENEFARELAGGSIIEVGDAIQALVHESDLNAIRVAVDSAWEDGEDRTTLVRFRRLDGGLRWCRLHIRAMRNEEGGGWFVASTDVTDEIEARAASDRLTALLEAATDVVAVFDPDGALLQLNRIGCHYLGVADDADLAGRTLFELFDPSSRERVRMEAVPTLRHRDTWSGEAMLVGPGIMTPVSLVLLAHRDDEGQLEFCSAIARDVTELKDVQYALAREATHDALTGLPNRTLLLDRLNHATLRAERTSAGLAVLYIDLDRVKLVNDSLGHEAGDHVLQLAAERLLAAAGKTDTVGRLGGDEFVVVAEDIDGPREAVRLAMRIVAAFEQPFDLDGTEAFVTASVGVAFRSGPGDTAATLLRDADVAMYRAKEAGGARYELFDARMRAWVTERFEIEAALRHAIERDELKVYFQPQLRPVSGQVIGFEALARWHRSAGPPVLPSTFIPLAEETGLIAMIGAHVLTEACRTAASWNEWRIPSAPLDIAVNVSARQLAQHGLMEVVQRALEATDLDPKRLTLEITESVLVQDPDIASQRLHALRDLGVRLALDDFGKGYSSLAYLQRFPLDAIKIDTEFVAQVVVDPRIVASIIDLAHALGFEIVAEGVETQEQHDALVELGCDVVQGHVYGRPLEADAAMLWLAGHEASGPHGPKDVQRGSRSSDTELMQ